MKMIRRLVPVFAVASLLFGVAALSVPAASPLSGGNCNPVPGAGRRHHCDPICGACEQVVCDGTGWCKFHCEPIPGCVR